MPAAVVAIGASVAGAAAASTVTGLLADTAFATVGGYLAGAVVSFGVQTLGNKLIGGGGGDGGGASALRQDLARGLLINTSSTVEPIPVIYGTRRVGGTRVFGPELSGDSKQFANMVFVWCEGPIDAVQALYLDDRISTDAFWNSTTYQGGSVIIYQTHKLGTDDQTFMATLRANVGPRWTSEHRLLGCAYSYVNLGFDADKFTGLPIVTADVRGRVLLDVRDASEGWSENPALVIRDYLTNMRYGRGLPESAIDDASFVVAANYCDQLVDVPDGAGGTTTQKRYTCNGVVDVDQTPLANVAELLSACRGMLIFTAGKYRLRIDAPESVGFAFDEDNIVGAWSITPGDKRTRANRVRARFFNAAARWQPDIVVVDSSAMRTQDNGLVLEREITLPFTSNRHTAAQIAQQELKQSRQSTTVQFRATLAALRVEVGDVVSITHSTPGWGAKPFRVLRLRLLANDEVEVVAREYDASVYTLDALDAEPEAPDTDLPDPLSVAPPGAPVVTETLYSTRDGAGVKAKASAAWAAAPDVFATTYQLEYRVLGSSQWTIAGRTAALTLEVADIAPAIYQWRVKALNNLGVASPYSESQQEIYGLLEPPAALAGLTISAVGGTAILRWTRSEDLDVRIGGRIEFRHAPVQSGATWETSTTIGEAVSGAETIAVMPLKAGSYLARPVDSAGVRATSATIVTTKAASVLAFSTLGTVTEHSTFSGTHDGTVADSGVLKLDSAGTVDDWSDVDSIANWDAEGGINETGTYTFAAGLDLTTVKRCRLTSTLAATVVNARELFDDRPDNIDDWDDFDGDAAGASGDAQVWVRETDDDPAGTPTWSAWQRLDAAEYEARAFQFQARLSVNDPAYNIEIDTLSVTAEELI